ncbi:hypothetical protein RF11_07645 [Thelohanellus kitauei]|uniref:Uncharacterized protein n=1 Tax=Thelohanellus kitauei TaxID=669202 RepID=A0A0C2IPC9_THEKT|nr:hypothetical protein RF11_07645 [Thelohanellus kitauei]
MECIEKSSTRYKCQDIHMKLQIVYGLKTNEVMDLKYKSDQNLINYGITISFDSHIIIEAILREEANAELFMTFIQNLVTGITSIMGHRAHQIRTRCVSKWGMFLSRRVPIYAHET